ncbi:MAG TPA: hypothetical protein VFN92_04965 [Solirubrobacterales bacterium]|nr:hypothetical protein [Solirubrobacterales bacterium]
MKHLKTLAIAGMTAAFLTVLLGAGSASATVLCKKNVIPCQEADYPANTTFHMTLEAETSSVFRDTTKNVVGTCTTSTIEGTTSNTGAAGKPVEGPLKALTFGGCASATAVIELGKFQIHYVAGTNTLGALTLVGTKVTISSVFGSCVYGSGAGVEIGELTGGAPAKADINTVVTKISGSFICPTSIVWEAKYVVTVPEPLYFKDS